MSVRQFVNRNPSVIAVVVVIAIGVCGWMVWSQTAGAASGKPSNVAYFTTDDGKTWFTDDVGKLPPFDKDGKPAVRAYLFKCGNAEPVVGYVERYTAKGKEITERYQAEQKATPGMPPKSLGEMTSLGMNATEVKKPGESAWIPKGQALNIVRYSCPNGAETASLTP